VDELFERLDELAANDDLDGVEKAALEALAEGATDPDLWRYIAWVRFEQGRLPQALEAAREGDDPLYQAKAHFHLWELDEARRALEECPTGGEDGADAEWYRGLCAEFSGQDPAPHFRRAAQDAPHLFHEPVRLDDAAVEAVVQEAIRSFPPEIARIPMSIPSRSASTSAPTAWRAGSRTAASSLRASRSTAETSSAWPPTAPRRWTSCASRCCTRSRTTWAMTRAASRGWASTDHWPTRGGSMPSISP
jgi:hypothetical protein